MHMNHNARDFPFYNGEPAALRAGQWVLLLLSVAVGFAALYLPIGATTPLLRFVPAILFPAIPLLVLRVFAGRHWQALFRRLTMKDVLLALGIVLLNLSITMVAGYLVGRFYGANANPVFGVLGHESIQDHVLFALQTLPQLLGEEVLTVIPFLALLAFFKAKTSLSQPAGIVIAWVLTAVLFGLIHLPTYQWNWVQCLLIIGPARLVLSLAYIWTRNLWVSTLAHVINDWILLGFGLLLVTLGHSSA